MKIAIYLNNSKIKKTDISNIELGNPGIGGTEYSTFLLARILTKSDLRLSLYLSDIQKGLDQSFYKVSPIESVFTGNNFDYIILNNGYGIKDNLETIKKNDVNIIIWAHIYFSCDEIKLYSCDFVKAIIFLTSQQYQLYKNEKIINKAFVINHFYPKVIVEKNYEINSYNVVFMGSLTKGKGFHILAKSWKKVIKKIPQAKLYVIGGGNLYNKSYKLGSKNLTNEKYERMIFRKIGDNSKVLTSIIFLGTLNFKRKNQILKDMDIGVVNPSGKTETFCLSAVELNRYGIPVITINDYSLPDVVKNGNTGILFNHRRQLSKIIVSLLMNNPKLIRLKKLSHQSIDFSLNDAVSTWRYFFSMLESGNVPKKINFSQPYFRIKKIYVYISLVIYKIFKIKIVNYFCLKEIMYKKFIRIFKHNDS